MAELAKIPGLRWRLYYEGGGTFSNLEGEPWESPTHGVIGVVQTDTMYNSEKLEGECFIYREDLGKWLFCGLNGLVDQLTHYARFISCYRLGRYVSNEEWHQLKGRMSNDPDFWAPLQKQVRRENEHLAL